MTITPYLFEAFLKCPTKCCLRFTCEPPSGNPYAEWVQTETESYRAEAAKRLTANLPADECAALCSSRREEAHNSTEALKTAKWKFAVDIPVRLEPGSSRGPQCAERTSPDGQQLSGGLGKPNEAQTSSSENSQSLLTSAATIETCLHAIERIPSEGRGKPAQFVPIRFIYRNKLTKDDKLLLALEALLRAILKSPSIHVDETKMNILGVQQYVWVLTNGIHVFFYLTPGREADFLHELLAQYNGTVVSDFYGGYDALPCRQQKCLVHLIRDLNDDLWKNPFDEEYEQFVAAVRDLIVPMIEDIQRYGLKCLHLKKHLRRVDRFYDRTITACESTKEIILKYKKRFERYKDSMFTFLTHDCVSWNNNAAERAIRHLAVQRKISGAFTTKGANHYLRLLAIAQTCRFQDKSFLGFLLSGLQNVDAYKESQRRSRR